MSVNKAILVGLLERYLENVIYRRRAGGGEFFCCANLYLYLQG